jgi:signal transduction histidine kinase
MKTQFLATMSQKLRSPLTALLGFVELLLHEELGEITPEQREALQSCRRSARRTFSLMDEALEFGRAEEATTQFALEEPPSTAEHLEGDTG